MTTRISLRPSIARWWGVLLLCCWVGTATAQHAATNPDSTVTNVPMWVQHVGEQLGQSLSSPADAVRHESLRHLAYFAYFYGDALDLSAALPQLMNIYSEDENEQCRLLAVAALHAIGDEGTMRTLRRIASERLDEEASMRVQLVTLAAVADYFDMDTFGDDDAAARLARSLLDYYTGPRVIVEPPILLERQ